jgi:hypothetical protein
MDPEGLQRTQPHVLLLQLRGVPEPRRESAVVQHDPAAGDDEGNFRGWNKYSIRGDHSIGNKDRISGLYHHGIREIQANSNNLPPGLPQPFNVITVWARRNTSGRIHPRSALASQIM